MFGESGSDRVAMLRSAGTLADGGEGDDDLQGGDDVRGGPGNDAIVGSRLLDGGEGNDTLRKTGSREKGRLAGGPGDDTLRSDDGWRRLPDAHRRALLPARRSVPRRAANAVRGGSRPKLKR